MVADPETTAQEPVLALAEMQKPERVLAPAAQRALAEAAERRADQLRREAALDQKSEVNGRGGKDPVRYNDWEIKGLTSDF